VQVDGREQAVFAQAPDDLLEHVRLGRSGLFGPGPDPVEVRLVVQVPLSQCGRAHVAHHQRQRARELPAGVLVQESLYRLQAHRLIAMQHQHHRDRR